MNIPITAIILTKNEEQAIQACLTSLTGISQFIVVDSGSSDSTVELAVAAGAEVVPFRWNGRYPKKKQWALELPNIRHDWVLFVDADERATPALLQELSDFVTSERATGFAAGQMRLSYTFMGRSLQHGHGVRKIALVDRRRAGFPVVDDLGVANMWEVEGHYQPIVNGKVYSFASQLVHLDPDPLFDYFARHNRYSDWEAYLINHPDVRSQVAAARSAQGRIYDHLPAKPLVFFIYSYILRAGWRDGRAGLDYALALAFYYWQIGAKVRDPNSALR